MAIAMIAMSTYKAYLIIYEFMHMKYEVPTLVKTVLLPTLLLVWAIIAFSMEGDYWNKRRAAPNGTVIEVLGDKNR
jgi:cytochrome c oxidase subunit IV